MYTRCSLNHNRFMLDKGSSGFIMKQCVNTFQLYSIYSITFIPFRCAKLVIALMQLLSEMKGF